MTFTTVTFNFAVEDGAPPERRPSGRLVWTPVYRREVDDSVLLPAPVIVPIEEGVGSTQVRPGIWRVREDIVRGVTRAVIVPTSSTPIPYADLVEVDMATLNPYLSPEPAWWTALRNLAPGVDPDTLAQVVQEAVDAAVADLTPALAHVDVVTGQESRPNAERVIWIGGTARPAQMDDLDVWLEAKATVDPEPDPDPVATAPTITTTSIASMTEGEEYTQSLAASGSTPITWGLSGGTQPPGIGINSSTGVLSGTPTAAGSFTFTVQATNSAGSDTQEFTVTVAAAPEEPEPGGGQSLLAAPLGTPLAYADGGGTLWTGNSFYGTRPFRVLGARIWTPADATGAALTEALTIRAFTRDWTGADFPQGSLPTGPAVTSAVITDPRAAGTWTAVTFPAPFDVPAAVGAVGEDDIVVLTMQSASGNIYFHAGAESVPGPATQSQHGDGVYLADASMPNGINSLGLQVGNVWYGLDLLYEAL